MYGHHIVTTRAVGIKVWVLHLIVPKAWLNAGGGSSTFDHWWCHKSRKLPGDEVGRHTEPREFGSSEAEGLVLSLDPRILRRGQGGKVRG